MGRFSEVVNEINTPEPPSGVLGANADQYSQADKVSRVTGLPVDAVQRNPQAAEETYRWKNIDFANLEKTSPKTAGLLSTPGKGELFNDDVDNLSGLERGFREINRIGTNLGNTAKAAYYRFGQSSAGLLQAGYEAGAEALDPLVGTVLPANPLRTGGDYFGDIARREKAAADYFRVSPEDAGFIERSVYSGIESFIQQTPGLVMSVLTASPAPMLAMAGGSEGGASYVEAREKGLGPWRSMNYASGQGALELVFEKIPAHQLLKDIGFGTSFMKTLVNQMAAEIPREQATTILQDLNTWASLNPERPFSEYIKERPSAFVQTLIATIVGTGGQVAVAQGTAAVMNRMGGYASNSKLRQRNVEAFEELVDELGAEAVYVDADAFRTYFQSQNIDPKAAAKELGVKDYDASLTTGEMLQIPASKYAARIAPTQHNAYFAKEIRLDPEMMNAREAEEYVKSLSTDIPTPEGGEQDVEDLILQEQTERLMAAGFDRQTAEDYASTVSAFFKTQAERYGVEAKELYDRYALEVTTENMPEGMILNQAGMDKWYRSALSETVKGIDKIADKNGMVQPAQAKSWLQSQQKKGAFKKEELEWVGVNDWLDTQEGKVSISDIQNFVDNSGIQIEDVELGAIYEFTATDGSTRQFTSKEAAENALNEEIEWAEKESTGDVIDNRDDPERPSISVTDYDGNEVFFASPNEDGDWSTEYGNDFYDADDAYNAAEEAMQKNIDYWLEQISSLEVFVGDGAAKYTEYQIPDGDNYREVLLTLPKSEQEYKSSHWDDENVVAHIRMNDRTDTDGNKVLFVEEVQSDWGQEARDRGFESSEMALERERVSNLIKANEEMRIAIMKERSAIPEDVEHSGKKYKIDKIFLSAKAYARNPLLDEMDRYVADEIQINAERMNPNRGTLEERRKIIETQPGAIERYERRFFESRGLSGDNIKEKLKGVLVDIPEAEQRSVPEIQKLREINNRLEELRSVRPRPIPAGIPSAPFVKDTKAWTALTIKRVIAMAADGGYDKVAFINGEQSADRYNLSKTVSKIYYNPKTGSLSAEGKNKQSLINQRDIPQEKLSDYIGKEAAEKIINNPTEIEADTGFHTLSGDGLVVGGEGMKAFYDRIVPQVANDVLKKTGGGKIERIDIETPNGNEWNGFSVTEEMRNQANSGLLLFQRQASLFPESNRLSNLDKNGATWKAILNENPELKNVGDTVTIYRATIGESIRPNDYVALNKAVADDHLDNLAERGETGRIITQEVPIDSLLMANDATEFVFSPSRLLDQKNRGYLSIGPDRKLKIGLLKDMDPSTFLHETGHAYLEVFRDMAKDLAQRSELTESHQQILADAEILKKWFGIQSLDDIQVEHHEQFARGYEAYLMEGNAPSVGMRRVFARFRAWLLAVYRDIRRLNVQLNDDVRGVMDRLLATDSELEAARKEAQSDPLFTTAEDAGMTEAEFKNYRKTVIDANLEAVESLQSKILKEKFREKEKWWKEQLANIAQDVETELNQRKDYIAADILRTGKSGEDDVPRLSRNDLKAVYSKEEMKALSRYVRAKGNVMTADEAADMFGFSSGDELVKTLINLPDKQLVIEQEARRRMIERHGNMMQDAAEFADAARHEVLSDKRKQVLEAELKALVKLQNKVKPFVRTEQKLAKAQIAEGAGVLRAIPPTRAFSDIAKGRIAAMQVRDVRPSKYLVASRKAAKEALASVTKQDYATAAIHKQREILNLELYREAQRVKARNEKHVEYLRSFEKPKVRARIAKTGFLDPIDQILEQYSFKRQTLRAVDRRKSLLAFVESQEAQGIPVNIPAEVLEGIDQVPYLELTNEQLEGVYDAVKVLANLHKLKQRLLKIRDKRTFDEYADALAGSIIDNHKGKLKDAQLESALPQKALGRLFKAYYAMHRKVPSYARVMDGHQDGGLAWEAFVRPINEAADREAVMREEAAIALQNIFKPYMTERVKNAANRLSFGLINKGLYRLEHYPYLKNDKFSGNLTKAGKLMVALNSGTESNRQRVMDGFGWSEANVQQLLNTLTQEDWQFVQGIWKQINSYWPEIKALAERVEGVAPAKVEGVQVITPFGQIEGMYFPISYDAVNSQKGFFTEAKEAAQRAMQGATIKNTTKHGFRKDRVEVVKGQPISLDMGNIYSHINDVIHDITHYEALIDANRLLKDGRIKSAIDQTQGNEAFRQFQSYLNDVASGDHWNKTVVEKTALWLRTGVSIAAMGYNLSTAAIQFTGASQSIVRIGPQWFSRGVKEWTKQPVKAVEDVQGKSSFMRLRSKTQLREINEIRNQVEGGAGQLTNSYFWMIAKMQMAVDMPTWLGQYQKSLASGESESKAIALADQAVKDSQGGGQVQDLAAIQRGNPLLKIFTAFYTYFNTTLNLTAESIGRADFTKPKDIGLMMVDMLMLYTVPAVLGILIRDALKGGDDEPIEERILREQLSYMLGTFVGLREAGSSVAGFYGYDGPAGARFFAEINKLSTQAQQGEMDRAFWKAFNNSAGILLHYPSGQVQKTVEGIIALQEGKTDNPKAILFGPEK